MPYSDPNYTDAEITLIVELLGQGIKWAEIRQELVTAGYRDRSTDALKRAMHRRREGFVRSKVHDPRPQEVVDNSESRLELRKLMRADAAFCKALERERPRT